MNCQICGYNIPEGKKFCPGCGRVLTAAELKSVSPAPSQPAVTDNTIVYRPASTGKTERPSSSTNIPDIFSSDPNAPEYRDPHTYDRATADILEYDRMFVSRRGNSDESSENTYDYSAPSQQTYDEPKYETDEYEENNDSYIIEPEYDDNDSEFEEDDSYRKKPAKPHINIKMLLICIALVAGLAIIITGVYQIGKQIGFWGSTESTSQTAEEDQTLGKKAPVVKEPDSTTAAPTSDYKIGVYTITSDQSTVFMYKSATDDRIIATVPNLEVIEITEISGEMGKTTYGSYTGWIKLEELIYTPDKKLSNNESTTKQPEATSDSSNNDSRDETTTNNSSPDSAGIYTVDLQGDGTYLNVRDTSSTDGNVVTTIDDGAEVTVDKVENGWGHITTPDGNEGWVYMVYLK